MCELSKRDRITGNKWLNKNSRTGYTKPSRIDCTKIMTPMMYLSSGALLKLLAFASCEVLGNSMKYSEL